MCAELPIAAIVNGSMLCVHSGITPHVGNFLGVMMFFNNVDPARLAELQSSKKGRKKEQPTKKSGAMIMYICVSMFINKVKKFRRAVA